MSDDDPSASHRKFYNDAYRKENYFDHREMLYRPYIRGLIAATGLKKASQVLDAGCGQGFFSHLFAQEGMTVYGTDMSLVGLTTAKKRYGSKTTQFFVADLSRAPTTHTFDCIFIRSCSLYNIDQFDSCARFTDHLLALLKPGGLFIFVYNTNLSRQSNGWRHHRLEDIKRVLGRSSSPLDLYFINKVDTFLLGHFAFNSVVTRINRFISERTRLGGEAVAVFRKHE